MDLDGVPIVPTINMVHVILLVFSVLIGVPRILGVKTQSYQAIAYLYIGGLIATSIISRKAYYGYLVIGLSILEILCFLYFKFIKKGKENGQR